MPSGFRMQLFIGATGVVLGVAALAAPNAIRVPVELAACLVGPVALYFRSFTQISDLPVRVGFSLIAVIASWIVVSIIVLALNTGLSNASAAVMLGLVYLMGVCAFPLLKEYRPNDKGMP